MIHFYLLYPHLIFRSLTERDFTTPILHVHDMMTKPSYTDGWKLSLGRALLMVSRWSLPALRGDFYCGSVLACLFPMLNLNPCLLTFLPSFTGALRKYQLLGSFSAGVTNIWAAVRYLLSDQQQH